MPSPRSTGRVLLTIHAVVLLLLLAGTGISVIVTNGFTLGAVGFLTALNTSLIWVTEKLLFPSGRPSVFERALLSRFTERGPSP